MTLDIVTAPSHSPHSGITLHNAVIIAVGTLGGPISINEAYESFRALIGKLNMNLSFSSLSYNTFEAFIHKLSKKGLLQSMTIETKDGRHIYTYFLSENGYRKYRQIIEEFRSSVRFMDAINLIRKSFWQ